MLDSPQYPKIKFKNIVIFKTTERKKQDQFNFKNVDIYGVIFVRPTLLMGTGQDGIQETSLGNRTQYELIMS